MPGPQTQHRGAVYGDDERLTDYRLLTQAAVAVLDAGGTAIEAGAAAKKVLDDSGYQCTPRPPPPPPPARSPGPRTSSPPGLASSRLRSRPGGCSSTASSATSLTPTQHTRTPTHPHPIPPRTQHTCTRLTRAVGDITKGAIKGFEGVVQEATGNEDYKFGDLTKNLAKNLFGGLEKGAAAAKKALENDDK